MLATGKLNWITPPTINPNVLAIEDMTSQKDLSFTVNDLVQAQLSDPVTSPLLILWKTVKSLYLKNFSMNLLL